MNELSNLDIAIVEDDQVVREGLKDYLQSEAFTKNVWAVESMELFFESISKGKSADVILSDIGLPGMSGIEGIKLIREKLKKSDIIMLTVFKDENRIFKSLCAGATGYLLKDTPFEEIKQAIYIIRNGGSFMSPAIARKVVEHFNPLPQNSDNNLTAREKQIIQGMVDGLSYKLIADRLGISIDTIRYHIKNIYNKLQINSRTQLLNKSFRGEI